MFKVSIIIPSRNEIQTTNEGVNVLQRTVQDIYEKDTGDFEVIVGFDGPPFQDFPDYPNLKLVKMPDNVGLRTMINILAIMAKGKYIFKSDGHCSFSPAFNEILQENMQDNWVMVPRFYVLDGKTWKWQDDRHYDYFYLSCPFTDPRGFRFKAGGHWPERTAEKENKPEYMIDETPSLHGSGWFVERDFFLNKIGGFPTLDPFGHGQDSVYLALKPWLGPWDSKLMVNKKVWHAHMHIDGNNRGFHMDRKQTEHTYNLFARYWVGDKWCERAHDFEWFVDRFMPMPTWNSDWREVLHKWKEENRNV